MSKVVLISNQRSGTKLLRFLLNSHPEICFFGEIVGNTENPDEFIEDNFPTREEKVVGFGVQYNQLGRVNIDDFTKILLIRRDMLRVAMKQRGVYELRSKDPLRIYVRPFMVAEYIKALKKHNDYWKQKADYTLYYEDFVDGLEEIDSLKEDVRKPLLEFLGVKDQELTVDYPRQNKQETEDIIVNYKQVLDTIASIMRY